MASTSVKTKVLKKSAKGITARYQALGKAPSP